MARTPTSGQQYDVIVVGVGGMGSAAAYHLSQRGYDVLGIERYDIPNSMGSSHGSTRIIRKVQPEGPEYVPLVERAYELWEDLEANTGRDLLHRTGSIHAGGPGTDVVEDAQTSCEANDIEYEKLSGESVNERFPGFELPEEFSAIFQKEGGFLDCEQSISAHVEAAHAEGATIHGREQVIEWSETEKGVTVQTDKHRYRADELLLTAGSWTSELLDSLAKEIVPVRALMTWLQPKKRELFTPDKFPVFVVRDQEEGGYGFPVYDVPGFKFGRASDLRKVTNPDNMNREPTVAEEELHRRYAKKFFPDAVGPTLSLRTCIQSYSADNDFVLGRVPDYDSVTVGTGFSGHGFKFVSVMGEILADCVDKGKTTLDISDHSIDRL